MEKGEEGGREGVWAAAEPRSTVAGTTPGKPHQIHRKWLRRNNKNFLPVPRLASHTSKYWIQVIWEWGKGGKSWVKIVKKVLMCYATMNHYGATMMMQWSVEETSCLADMQASKRIRENEKEEDKWARTQKIKEEIKWKKYELARKSSSEGMGGGRSARIFATGNFLFPSLVQCAMILSLKEIENREIQVSSLIFFRFICFRRKYLKCPFTFFFIFGCELTAGLKAIKLAKN